MSTSSFVAAPLHDVSEVPPANQASGQLVGVEPIDLFATSEPPPLPSGLLPGIIEDFARIQSELMGADPAGLAMAALAVSAAAVTDDVILQPKVWDEEWTESARIWTALIGDPSTKKSPILRTAAKPLMNADAKMFRDWQRQMAEFNALPKEDRSGKEPPQKRKRLEDVTIEAAQDVLKDNPEGLLCLQDELSGWFGGMDKYAGAKGAMKDRSWWLQCYNGGPYAVNRISRGASFVPNASVCVLGGIQPEPIRKVAREAQDDGLLQRLLPIVLRDADVGIDRAPPRQVVREYARLVDALLNRQAPLRRGFGDEPEPAPLRFDDEAQKIRRELEAEHLELARLDAFNRKLGAHFGKYDGIFARLALLFHVIEHAHADTLPGTVTAQTAERARRFLHDFLRPHAVAFYHDVLSVRDGGDQLTAVAAYILAHEREQMTLRDVQRGCNAMRGMSKDDVRDVMGRLEVAGWVTPSEAVRSDSTCWDVNPIVHQRFAQHAARERHRRAEINRKLRSVAGWGTASG